MCCVGLLLVSVCCGLVLLVVECSRLLVGGCVALVVALCVVACCGVWCCLFVSVVDCWLVCGVSC